MDRPPKITFAEFTAVVADEAGVSQKRTNRFLHELVKLTLESVVEGERVIVPGLGSFDRSWRNPRAGLHPQTREVLEIEGQYRAVFKPDTALRRFVNQKYADLKAIPLADDIVAARPLIDEPMAVQEVPVLPKPPSESVKNRRYWIWLLPLLMIMFWLGIVFVTPSERVQKLDQINRVTEGESKPFEEARGSVSPPEESVLRTAGVRSTERPVTSVRVTVDLHEILMQDNLWKISDFFYGNAYLWPNLYRANQNEIRGPDLILIGDVLEIPPLEGEPGSLTQNDLTDISEGYLLVYFEYSKEDEPEALDYLWVASRFLDLTQVDRASRIKAGDLQTISTIKGRVRFK